MAHPQNSHRGLFAKDAISMKALDITVNTTGTMVLDGGIKLSSQSNATITGNTTGIVLAAAVKVSNKANAYISGDSTGVVLNAGLKISNKAGAVLTGNTTATIFNAGVTISNKKTITANTTGLILPTSASKPAARSSCKFAVISNSTGKNYIAVNTTGATWAYLSETSVAPH